MLIWIFYVTTVQMVWMLSRHVPLPISPVAALEPFRIANRYGLFAVMTRGRYEIEFQGSNDGEHWDDVSLPLQAAGPRCTAAHLRSLSAALRLEFVVRIAGLVAREHDRSQHGRAPARRLRRTCCDCSPATLSRSSRRSRFVRCSGNTGSPAWRRSEQQACGGGAN